MKCKCFFLTLALISSSNSIAAEEIELRIIIGPNANSRISHYEKIAFEMNALLRASESSGCGNSSVRLAAVRRFQPEAYNGDPVNSNQKRLDLIEKLLSYEGNILGVRALNACGTKTGETIAGCAGIGNPVSVEITQNARKDAVVILHEIGHSLGMSWETASDQEVFSDDKAHVTDPKRLMHKFVSGTATIDQSECNRFSASSPMFKARPGTAAATDLILVDAGGEIQDAEVLEIETDLEAVLSRIWQHEVPFEELDRLSSSPNFLNQLRGLTLQDDKIELWKHALSVIGYYGEESDISFLRSFLDRSIVVDDSQMQTLADTKIQAAISLGYLTARHRSTQGEVIVGAILTESAMAFVNVESQGLPSVNLNGLSDSERRFVTRSLLYAAYDSTALIRASQGLDTTAASMDERLDDFLGVAPGALSQPGDLSRLALEIDENFLGSLADAYAGVELLGVDGYLRSK